MQYEVISRALAYVSCLSTLSLLLTSVAIAAVHIGSAPLQTARSHTPTIGIVVANDQQLTPLMSPVHLDALAVRLWSAKT